MVETVNRIINLLNEREIDTTNINTDGIVIGKVLFTQIVDIIHFAHEYKNVRGHVQLNECFNVSYESNFFSYERLSEQLWLGKATISYKKADEYKIFISENNWIDLFVNYNENSYATVVVVPK